MSPTLIDEPNEKTPMTNFHELALEAVNYLRPELLLLAGKAVGGAATESGKQAITWFRERLTGKSAEAALDDAVAHPEDERRLQALQQQIEILLEDNQQFRTAIQALLTESSRKTPARQAATVTGKNNKVAQVSGNNNNTQIQ